MSLSDQLHEDLKAAMKDRNKIRVETLRMLRAQIKDSQIAKRQELTDDDVFSVLNNAAKKRREAMELYAQSDRSDLLEQETRELEIIQAYLPEQLTRAEVEEVISQIINDVGATSVKDLGKVMGIAMQQLKGKADGRMVQEISRLKLG